MKNPDTIKIFEALENKARFVGGCVRNKLLGIGITDIDIATECKPEDTMARLESVGIRVIPTGIKHGTVTAVLNGHNYEITTLRRDIECYGRHAEVEYTDDWQEDAARRDFTINAMSMDIDGKIYDYFGGQEDLQKGVVRFVGDAENRVREDVLRILRFFRFYAYYGKPPVNAEAMAACAKIADKIPTLSGERIQTEMLKLLACEKPIQVLQMMQEEGVNKYIFPCQINIKILDGLESEKPLLKLAALLSGAGEGKVGELADRWKLSNKDKAYLHAVLFPIIDVKEGKKAVRRIGKEVYKDVVILEFAAGKLGDTQKEKLIAEADVWEIPEFPVRGKDLQEMGIASGKQMGKILAAAEEWWEEQLYTPSKEDIIDYISKNLR